MAYDKNKIFEEAKAKIIANRHVVFIEDIVSMLPCSKNYFYDNFPTKSNEYDEIKYLLEKNKTANKMELRKKWFDAETPALQMAVYKLMATQEELKSLSMTHTDVTSNGQSLASVINIGNSDVQV